MYAVVFRVLAEKRRIPAGIVTNGQRCRFERQETKFIYQLDRSFCEKSCKAASCDYNIAVHDIAMGGYPSFPAYIAFVCTKIHTLVTSI